MASWDQPARYPWAATFRDRQAWLLCAIYLLLGVGFYGATFWLPQVVSLLTGTEAGGAQRASAGIFALAGVAMISVARWSDRTGHVRPVVCIGAFLAALGFCSTALLLGKPTLALVTMSLGAIGLWSVVGAFWQLSAMTLEPHARGIGLAQVNACGSLGGFIGPLAVGALRARFAGFAPALVLLAGALFVAAVLASRSRAPRLAISVGSTGALAKGSRFAKDGSAGGQQLD